MSIFITGDVHGELNERFSFNLHPELRSLTSDDFIIVAGDFGGVWDFNEGDFDFYWLDWLNKKPWTTIVVCGNHENYDLIEKMPQVNMFGGTVRICKHQNKIFNSIIFIDETTIIDVCNNHILCIPGAESHDIDILLDPNDENFKTKAKFFKKKGTFFRIKGQSWWPQEKINVKSVDDFIDKHDKEHFDIIISHDCPSKFFVDACWHDVTVTEGESFLNFLSNTLDFDFWFHGHMHMNNFVYGKDENICCLYTDLLSLEEK